MLAVLLSFDSIDSLFKQRASLDQSYDEGRFGRFGRHILGFQMALDLPLGIGPLQFTRFFPEDTHNSYLNAFMSGGWIAGICYPALVFITVIIGFRHVFVRVPWQQTYLAIFAAFLGTVGESFIIDTDHWRHFWMMIGTMWGMFAAAHATSTAPITRRRLRRYLIAAPVAAVQFSTVNVIPARSIEPLDQAVAHRGARSPYTARHIRRFAPSRSRIPRSFWRSIHNRDRGHLLRRPSPAARRVQ